MPQVFVSIGSNIDRATHIRTALRELRERYCTLTVSTIYESSAIGFDGDNFYNLVAAFRADTPVRETLDTLRDLERRHGRIRSVSRFAPRTLDLDLLLYGDLVRNDAQILIPRPEITQYAFVLRPLAEIAPDLQHPGLGITYGELWAHFCAQDQRLWPVETDLI